MRKNYYFKGGITLLLTMCMYLTSYGQVTVSGQVMGDGEGLPGVNVLIMGTSEGTVTDFDGNYSLSVSASDASLVYTSIGYVTQTVAINNRSVIDITMETDITELSEVVVTALGVERDVKSLNYSVTQVGGDQFTQARENSIGNALSGRIAGVNVSNVASGPAGSARVIIRGNKSLNGSNQPLYVIDGIPMDNSQFGDNNGQAGQWSGQDQGDGLASINPDDIESISVLKGAAAAALYGSRGGNGVINIITKKGSQGKGVQVSFNSNFVAETVNNLSDLQQSYGAGNYVNGSPVSPSGLGDLRSGMLENSWGPRLGSGTFFGVDGVTRPNEYAGDNWKRFYNTGTAWTNSISIAGGTENASLRFSVSDLKSDGVVPNSGFDRTNLSLSGTAKFAKKFSLDTKVMYSNEVAKNRPTVSDSPGNAIQAVWRRPPNVNIDDLKGDPNKLGAIPDGTSADLLDRYERVPGDELLPSSNNNWGPNPWWVANHHIYTDTKDRIIASGRLRYDITDFLYATAQIGMDRYTRKNTRLYPQGSGDVLGGSMEEGLFNVEEINTEWTLGFDKTFDKISVNGFIGGNKMRRKNERIRATTSGFNVPFQGFINNGGSRNFGYEYSEAGINSLFGSAQVGYDGILFLTATARQDWFSVLNDEFENSVFYPSVGASFVFSDAFEGLPSWFSFGKLRASYGKVGVVTINPYDVANSYALNGNTHLGRALGTFSRAQGRSGTIPNPELIPATSNEIEVGFDARLFNDRFGVDFTYYSQQTLDDIVSATIPLTSGFASKQINVGELTNKGIELLVYGTPIKGDVTWDVSFNFAKNVNEVVSLLEGVDFLVQDNSRTQTTAVRHVQGGSYGEIWGVKQRIVDGQPVYRANGSVRGEDTEYQYLGNGVADWTGGLNNSFTYKGINFSFLIDIKVGGVLHSGTNDRLTSWGLHKQSLIGREGEGSVIHITGLEDVNGDGSEYVPVDRDLTPDQARQYWGGLGGASADSFVYDAGFGKLRQVTLGYSLPRSVLDKTPFTNVTLSFVGRNLAILWKNVENIDPESSYSSNGGAQGLDYFGMPTTRSYGFNLKLGF